MAMHSVSLSFANVENNTVLICQFVDVEHPELLPTMGTKASFILRTIGCLIFARTSSTAAGMGAHPSGRGEVIRAGKRGGKFCQGRSQGIDQFSFHVLLVGVGCSATRHGPPFRTARDRESKAPGVGHGLPVFDTSPGADLPGNLIGHGRWGGCMVAGPHVPPLVQSVEQFRPGVRPWLDPEQDDGVPRPKIGELNHVHGFKLDPRERTSPLTWTARTSEPAGRCGRCRSAEASDIAPCNRRRRSIVRVRGNQGSGGNGARVETGR